MILSLGKLAELSRAEDDDEDDTLDEFDRGLNFVSVQKDLLDQFSAVLAKLRGRQSLESQIDAVLKEKASKLEDRPALGTVRVLLYLYNAHSDKWCDAVIQKHGEGPATRTSVVSGRCSRYADDEG